jgi:hypothetical protein
MCAATVFGTAALGEPLPREQVPEPLRPWVDWALRGHEDAACPFFEGQGERRQCAWPSRLALDLGDGSGRMTQQWRAYRDAWAPLPGDASHAPEDVRLDGKPAVVVMRDGLPTVRLPKGAHEVTATFSWKELPELLSIPTETGLVSLVLDGKPVAFPRRDPQGQLWLKSRSPAASEEARLDVRVFRRVIDEIPLELETRVELRVSGKNREMLLSRALPDGFVPMSLTAPLPARLDPDGRLRVQVRPGVWTITLVARHQGPVAELRLPAVDGPWAAEEVWAFEGRNDLRLVSVEGVDAIDPQQTELPAEWRRLAAYPMRAGSTMKLVERRRGNAEPSPDQLSIARTWWLDFDGGGYTIQDQVSGSLSQSWRLDMASPAALGRVAVGGRDQLITRGKGGAAGVEIREGTLQLSADSRIVGRPSAIPAVGWDHDFQQASGVLNLPPGWRLVHASGVDDVSSTWISEWTLLDLFLVMIIALAAAQLWGRAWGAAAALMLALTYLEPGAPRWLWLALLAGEALLVVLPAGRLERVVRGYRLVVALALVIAALPFAIAQIRAAMYPALEMPYEVGASFPGFGIASKDSYTAAVAPKPASPAEPQALDELERQKPAELQPGMPRSRALRAEGGVGGTLAATGEIVARKSTAGSVDSYRSERRYLDDKAKVSTGPGLPRWQWRSVSLSWRGPVERGQQLRLWLLSPAVDFVLALLRVALLGAILLRALRTLGERGLPAAPAPAAAVVALVAAAVAGFASPASAADFPPPEIVKELADRLLEHPECYPSCAASPRLRIEADPQTLVLRVEIDAAADTAVPLPGGLRAWSPSKVVLDAEAAPPLARDADGSLWTAVGPGKHQLVLEGPLRSIDAVEIPLPLQPRRVETTLRGWSLEGVREDGVPENSIRLARERNAESGAVAALEPGEMPPFVRLEREIDLGLSWEVDTVLTRLTPAGTSFAVAVPLLEGESVTTPGIRVENGQALASFAPSATQVRWSSTLKQTPRIELKSTADLPVAEVWRLAAGPLWHVEVSGIPEIHVPAARDWRVREWRPWPGESVTLAVDRPEPAPGQTLTVDHTALDVTPGLRATDATLTIELRSSLGGQHVLTLPVGAELQSIAINGAPQPIRQDNRTVTVPIVPGAQTITLAWRSPQGIAARIRAPQFSVGLATVNADTTIHMSEDRWTLALGGGRLGPAVLFWSVLAIVLVVSVALGRLGGTPLGPVQWFLLGIGLTQAPIGVAALVVGWPLALGWRLRHGREQTDGRFNFVQVGLAVWTAIALGGLFAAIEQGLLGLPEMQIVGNGSSAQFLHWFHDRTDGDLPRPWVFSVPLWVYRVAMLAWALWIASALLAWLRWAWTAYSEGGLWRQSPHGWRWRRRKEMPPATPAV